ncbi:hypothetical protein MSAN_02440100 [Mycena sanguinolenta]|uniref:Uncharacterized protein n=1 Tax=Mycena sanguinolenta TaxID=230812 RepID=A0A8H7CD60_9AGAR|nr:hypothetical protein MSAN_02440100 [Mycena sanguinolenta]
MMSVEMADELTDITSPLLESVEFNGLIPTPNQLKFFQVPSVRTVALRLGGSEPLNAVLTMPLMWNQLQHLTITGISFSHLIIILGQCLQLISINVTPIIDDAFALAPSDPTESNLPSLASFTIPSGFSSRSVAPRSLNDLISHVSMPQLRHFNVPAANCQYEAQNSFFLATLGKKSPLVEDLTIYLSSLTAQSLPETLRAFSSLARLVVFDVDTWPWDHDGFQSCTVTMLLTVLSHSSACPMLQELVVHDCSSLDSKSTLDEFVRQRTECAHRLRRLDILFERSWTGSQVSSLMSETEIQSYLVQGLDIALRCQNTTPWVAHAPDPWTGLWPEDF